jgi:hypothetical protein
VKKEQEKKRILTRLLATELSNEELKKIAGSVTGTNSLSKGYLGDAEDDCDEIPRI